MNITVDALLAAANGKTGLTDWGDISFQQPLQVLVDSFLHDNSDGVTHIFFRNECIRLLCNRLLIEQDFKQYPEIDDVPISKPLFIIGLGRTGSTFLHNLLSQDPFCRSFQYWELLRPSPPPDIHTRNTDPRIKLTEKEIAAMQQRIPDFWRMHEMKATNPEECCFLMLHTFLSRHFYVSWNVPSYAAWLCRQDLSHAYKYYKKLLQLLLFRTPGTHLVLKDPIHLPSLELLLQFFPDANFVWTHREPAKVVSSYYSLSGVLKGKLPLAEINAGISQLASDIETAMKVRGTLDPNRFYDINYNELIKDPVNIVKGVYDHFGYALHQRMSQNIQNWLEENKQHKYGVHKHTLEDLQIDPDYVNTQFVNYYREFQPVLS